MNLEATPRATDGRYEEKLKKNPYSKIYARDINICMDHVEIENAKNYGQLCRRNYFLEWNGSGKETKKQIQ